MEDAIPPTTKVVGLLAHFFMSIFRYRSQSIDLGNVRNLVQSSLEISQNTGFQIVDISITDDTLKPDLDIAMNESGYIPYNGNNPVVSTDPPPGLALSTPDGYIYTLAIDNNGTTFKISPTGVSIPLNTPESQSSNSLVNFYLDGNIPCVNGAYCENLPTGSAFPTSIIWWTDSGKTKKIIENILAYGFGSCTYQRNVYAVDGMTVVASTTIIKTFFDTFYEINRKLIIQDLRTIGPYDYYLAGNYPNISENYKEVSPDTIPTSVIWWTDYTKVKKIVEKTIVFNSSYLPTSVTRKIYNRDGTTVVAQAVDTFTYSTIFESNRTRTIS